MNTNLIKVLIKIEKIVIIFLIIFSISMIDYKNSNEKESILTSSQGLSNKKIGWGVKRAENHNQPDFGKENTEIIKKCNAIAIGNNKDKSIYLTFDLGYEAGYTEQILQALKENNITATFFITAHYLNTEPDLVKKMIENKNIVGNHTCNHYSMPDLTEEKINSEVMDLHKSLFDKFQYEMKYIRPPKGEFSERTINITNSLGYKTVLWSFAYADWDESKQPEENEAKKKILDNIHNGEIMLLHGNSKTNANILSDLIKEIKSQGYEFKSLDDFS